MPDTYNFYGTTTLHIHNYATYAPKALPAAKPVSDSAPQYGYRVDDDTVKASDTVIDNDTWEFGFAEQ